MTDKQRIEMLELKVSNLELELRLLKLQKNIIIYPSPPYQWPDDTRQPQQPLLPWYQPWIIS